MKQFTRFTIMGLLLSAVMLTSSCSLIDEDACQVNYVEYRYMNNQGALSTYPYLVKVTDFIYSKDSILFRVDDNITNGKIAKRPITLPDGDWIVYSYANFNGGSTVSPYVIGQTHLKDMSLRVSSPSGYTGTYAPSEYLRIGDADRLYFGKLTFTVKDGTTDRPYVVDMSNIHIWLSGTIRWKQPITFSPLEDKDLHVRLEYVPIAFSFMNDDKMDPVFGIPYSTPRITDELAIQPIQLMAGATPQEYTFQMYGLRWETGRAPVLRIYNGETLLVTKELPLNKYFDEQMIDLTQTRVQFFNLLIEVDENIVTISDISLKGWEDGGFIG